MTNALVAPDRPVSFVGRGLRREQAAAYVGVSPSSFDKMVREGAMPEPIRWHACVLWDRRQIDLAMDSLFGTPAETSAVDWSDVQA